MHRLGSMHRVFPELRDGRFLQLGVGIYLSAQLTR
jgi:hypothetical protein